MRRALNAVLPWDAARAHRRRSSRGLSRAVRRRRRRRITTASSMVPWCRRSRRATRGTFRGPSTSPRWTMRPGGLVGEHDFGAFQSTGGDVRTTTRRDLRVVRRTHSDRSLALRLASCPASRTMEGHVLVYAVTGSGFLRHMVRAIVGTLVEVGSGRGRPDADGRAAGGRNRADAGPTAPAQGLCLVSVRYPPDADKVAAHR